MLYALCFSLEHRQFVGVFTTSSLIEREKKISVFLRENVPEGCVHSSKISLPMLKPKDDGACKHRCLEAAT